MLRLAGPSVCLFDHMPRCEACGHPLTLGLLCPLCAAQEPFLKIRENNWGLQTNFKRGGRRDWLLTYDL